MEYCNQGLLLSTKYDSYFDIFPEELILIVIGYVDLSNKKGNVKLLNRLEGFIFLSNRYKNIFDNYMNLIDDGCINNFKDIICTYIVGDKNEMPEYLIYHLNRIETMLLDDYKIKSNPFRDKYIHYYFTYISHPTSDMHIELIYLDSDQRSPPRTIGSTVKDYYYIDYEYNFGKIIYNIKRYSTWIQLIKNISDNCRKHLFEFNNY